MLGSYPADIRSEYVILIVLPRQQWLRERASMLHYVFIVALVLTKTFAVPH
jgi:hypothetical protein